MAIAFANISIHSRAKGHSAIAAAAYRSGTRLLDERTGIVHDYTNRKDLLFSETLLPAYADSKFLNREFLWNQVELSEHRKDAQICKDVVLALPKELELVYQIELAKRFANTHFVAHGIPADVALHDHGDGNPHAHILIATRRLEKTAFSKYKARDLNPSFYSGKIIEKDYWGEQWRTFQNDFFKEKEMDLVVDLNHLISERHQGKSRGTEESHLEQENQFIKEQRIHLALNHEENLINHISVTHSVFTRRDIEKLVFKTLKDTEFDHNHLAGAVEKVVQHKDLIYLGVNDSGQHAYTTRNQYIAEANLLDAVEQLFSRSNHSSSKSTKMLAEAYQLNEEQRQAFDYIVTGSDLSVLIGRPGVGKSYLLKPVKEYYEAQGKRLLGASLSGKVAKALQVETGIPSYTLASLNYRLQRKMLSLNKNDIIVIDEAGMIDFANFSSIIEAANKAKAKIIMVGDPDQLKPINKGEIFRAIASHTGYIELSEIRRQKDQGDRAASLMLAKGEINNALNHYNKKGSVHFYDTVSQSATQLVHHWHTHINEAKDIQENVMFAFKRSSVASLNKQARSILQNGKIISQDEFLYTQVTDDNPLGTIALANGERILFRKNDSKLGVRNGDMAFIHSINNHQFSAKLDSGESVIIPNTYQHIDYGYATTVHKGQGMTVDNASILIDSKYWDRFLSFVAMTRHRMNLSIYADKQQHPNIEALNKTLSRASTKDNVIDWPLDLAIRYGFNPDSLIGRVTNYLAGVGNKIKEKYNYVVHYEAYARDKFREGQLESKQKVRDIAKKVANYLDAHTHYHVLKNNLTKEAALLKIKPDSLDAFKSLYTHSIVRDQKASELWTTHRDEVNNVPLLKAHQEKIQQAAERYERYLIIKELAKHPITLPLSEQQIMLSTKIDLQRDKIHLIQLAKQIGKNPAVLFQQVEKTHTQHKKQVLNQLKKEHPILDVFTKLLTERNQSKGIKAEQMDKLLAIKANEIIANKELYTRLKKDLPQLVQSLSKVKNHDLSLCKEH